jgi:hypothetical protein
MRPVILPSAGPFTFGIFETSTCISTRPEGPPVSTYVNLLARAYSSKTKSKTSFLNIPEQIDSTVEGWPSKAELQCGRFGGCAK